MASTLVVFDFDNTLVLTNTDTHPFSTLHPPLLESLRHSKTPWQTRINTALSALTVSHLHTADSILNTMSTIPVPSPTLHLLHHLFETPSTHAAILSDSNTLYISAILHAHNLSPSTLEAGIYTNHAQITSDNILHIQPSVFTARIPHTSGLACPSNLCKGAILTDIRPAYRRVIYVGDGINDLCPVRTLHHFDFALPRFDFPLDLALQSTRVRARIMPWNSPAQLSHIVRHILQTYPV